MRRRRDQRRVGRRRLPLERRLKRRLRRRIVRALLYDQVDQRNLQLAVPEKCLRCYERVGN